MARQQKLKFKPTPISRLRTYKSPIKMVGDPDWGFGKRFINAWQERERVVYRYEMERKAWPYAWLPETWTIAQADNERIDRLLSVRWDDFMHHNAHEDNKWFDHDEAWRDNAAWDYHHEYAVDLEVT